MSWFDKIIPPKIKSADKKHKTTVPEGLWKKCKCCEAVLYCADLALNHYVCPKCSHHMRISARTRLELFLDKDDSAHEIATRLTPVDFLKFRDKRKYKDRLQEAQKQTHLKDALLACTGKLFTMQVVVASFDFNFMGGSMGSVVGERFSRSVQQSIDDNCPLVCFSTSGGARMQEGLFSLMQMAKTSFKLTSLAEHNLPYISVITDPTMGGVCASLAMLGDINIAEPNARVGFAGRRVIEQTVRENLPEGFQCSEFLMAKGAIDMIVDRRDMRTVIHSLLRKLMGNRVPQQKTHNAESGE